MFNAAEAKKMTEEMISRKLEEKLESRIKEACAKGEHYIFADLTKTEEKILKGAGYKVEFCSPSYKISWD